MSNDHENGGRTWYEELGFKLSPDPFEREGQEIILELCRDMGWLDRWKAEALAEGRLQGLREVTRNALTSVFGDLSSAEAAYVETADAETCRELIRYVSHGEGMESLRLQFSGLATSSSTT